MASTVPPPMSAAITTACGFDVGSENCYIAVARAGGIEILLNDYSQRSTPAYIGFGDNQREIGVSAKQKQMMNLSNTCYAPNRMVGRQASELSEPLPFQVESGAAGELAVRVWHNGEERDFSATQIAAMLFTKLRQVSSNSVDCVINCPVNYTDAQRRALMDAAVIAGLNPIRIIPDMTAISLYYGFYRTAAPNGQDFSIVAFVDIGNVSTQCAIALFNNKEHYVRILAVEYDENMGGKHFDELLANYFADQQKLKLNKRSRYRLVAECEKLKKQMSANSNDLPINIECLYDEKDFSGKMDRSLFEQLSESLLARINTVFQRTLQSAADKFNSADSGLSKLGEFKIDSVEVVGGTSRIPAVKRLVRAVFGADASTTLNADEAVARGCALQCALLSPTFKVARQIQVIDYAPYQINCRYWHQTSAGKQSEFKAIQPLFARGFQMPFTKQVTITCQSLPIVVAFDYVNDSNQVVPIGEYNITSQQTIQISKNQLKIRVRLDPNGIIVLQSAVVSTAAQGSVLQTVFGKLSNKNGENEVEDVENSNNAGETQNSSQPMETDDQQQPNSDQNLSNNHSNAETKEERKSKKPKATSVDLQIEPLWIRGKLSEEELNKCKEIELNLIMADKNWKEKINAKNALEEFIYEWRDKLESSDYDRFVASDQKQQFLAILQSSEQWLFEQEDSGEVHSKSVYEEHLIRMREGFSDGINYRKREFETRNTLMEQLGQRLQQGRKVCETGDESEAETVKKLAVEIDAKQKWFDEASGSFGSLATAVNPVFTCDQIKQQIDALDSQIRQIVNDRNRRNEEKRKQAEAAKQAPPPPPPPSTANPESSPRAEDTPKDEPTAQAPQMEVDADVHQTI